MGLLVCREACAYRFSVNPYMPLYRFSNPSNSAEFIDIVFHMNDIKEYFRNGIKWNREYFIPLTAVDCKVDPYSSKDFIRATNKKGTIGDLWARSGELGEKRKDKDGIDFIKQNTIKDYEKKVGKLHANTVKENARKKLAKMNIDVE